MQFYLDRERRHDPYALPDAEVFWWAYKYQASTPLASTCHVDTCYQEAGWYWWACFPGCLPDSEPHGPFPNMFRAIRDARRH